MTTRRHATLTIEDLDIWVTRAMEYSGHRTPGWLRLDSRESDRRDAELMLRLSRSAGPPAWRLFYRHKFTFERYGKFST